MALAITMTLSINTYAVENNSKWADEYITEAHELNIVPESMANSDLTLDINREEFCELVYNAVDLLKGKTKIEILYVNRKVNFSDTSNEAVIGLKKMGVISGRTSTKFDPYAFVTREEAAVIFTKIAKLFELTEFKSNELFDDRKEISSWAKDSINIACGMNIMSGMGDGRFNPKGKYTKEQAISSVIRLLNNIPDDSSTEKIDNKRYYKANKYYKWIENEKAIPIFKVSAEKYNKMNFYSNGEKILAFAVGNKSTDIYDIESKRILFSIPAVVIETNADRFIIASDAEGKVFGVYDFNGNEILPVENTWEKLFSEKFVTRKSRV